MHHSQKERISLEVKKIEEAVEEGWRGGGEEVGEGDRKIVKQKSCEWQCVKMRAKNQKSERKKYTESVSQNLRE